jgi:dipeptidyl aminopeptidase/acylaminoacyl peptidase
MKIRRIILLTAFGLIIAIGGLITYLSTNKTETLSDNQPSISRLFQNNEGGPDETLHPMAIESLRQREYPGSEIVIEQELTDGSNYKRYIASYKSEGLRIYGLLTIPNGPVPRSPEREVGWPAIMFNHGYIQPSQYVTTQKYVEYLDGFARNGYVVFKPDYRGHGNSEGTADGNYFSPSYVVDVLNATSSVQKMSEVNPEKIGMWGHSMGGNITMKNLVVTDNIKAAVIWAGVVGSYNDILNNWSRAGRWRQSAEHRHQGPNRQNFVEEFGAYGENPEFWSSIDPYTFIDNITALVQIHHGTGDTHVPFSFSNNFKEALDKNNKSVQFYSYEGADHNLSGGAFSQAMSRSVEFFDGILKK